MSRPPTVSLILTVFNEGGSINRLLHSIDQQTRLPEEVVICDAGSTDSTVSDIQAWSRQTTISVNLIVAPGANISRGRNIAIEAARGQLIAATDGGCVLDAHWLERLTRPMEADPKLQAVYGGTNAIGHSWFGRLFADFYNYKTHSAHLTNTEHSSRSVAFRKSAWKAVDGYPEWLTLAGEDTLFFQNLDEFGDTAVERLAFVHWHHGTDTLYQLYRVHRRNTIGSGEANLWPLRYTGLVGLHLIALAAILLTPFNWAFGLAGAMMLVVLWSRSSLSVFRYNHRLATFIGLPAVFAARDLGSCVGYIIGIRRRQA